MNRSASLVLLLGGIALLACGWDAYRSLSSEVSRLVTGAPTDRALFLLIAGGLATAAGIGGLVRPPK